MDYLVVGCGLSGAVVARTLAEHGFEIEIWERRHHIGGNMFDEIDEHGFLVQRYGPHAFHTNNGKLIQFIRRFENWQDYTLLCGAEIDNKVLPVPFNCMAMECFCGKGSVKNLRIKACNAFCAREEVPIAELLNHSDSDINSYGQWLLEKDYAPYASKQWMLPFSELDKKIVERVPVRFSYDDRYHKDAYQVIPVHSYTSFFNNLLDHPKIQVRLGIDALDEFGLDLNAGRILVEGSSNVKVIYTGALDELFGMAMGQLPYRSLYFEWKYSHKDSVQPFPVVAYPTAKKYTRVTEYKKLPVQKGEGSSYAIEYPVEYSHENGSEPYYPVLTKDSQRLYREYLKEAKRIKNLYLCGRLADFKYYDMDDALLNAMNFANRLIISENGLRGIG